MFRDFLPNLVLAKLSEIMWLVIKGRTAYSFGGSGLSCRSKKCFILLEYFRNSISVCQNRGVSTKAEFSFACRSIFLTFFLFAVRFQDIYFQNRLPRAPSKTQLNGQLQASILAS